MSLLDTFAHLDWAQVLQLTWQHIMLVGVAVGLAILVGVPLGILMTRFPAFAGPLQASATVLLTIPSIALFGLLLPFYSRFGQGLGHALSPDAVLWQRPGEYGAPARRRQTPGGAPGRRTASHRSGPLKPP